MEAASVPGLLMKFHLIPFILIELHSKVGNSHLLHWTYSTVLDQKHVTCTKKMTL